MKKNAVIFLPELGIYPYTRTLSIFADALKQQDYDIYFIDCDNILPRCIMQACYKFAICDDSSTRRELCKKCATNLNAIVKKYGFRPLKLGDYIPEDFFSSLKEIFPEDVHSWPDIEYKGCKVGQIAIHDLMLETKVLDTDNLSDFQQLLYKQYISTMCCVITAANEIIAKDCPSIFLTFNPYCQNQAVQYACKINGILYKSITGENHFGANYSLLRVSDATFTLELNNNIQSFNNSIPISPKMVEYNFFDSLYRMFMPGSNIFSSRKIKKPDFILEELELNPNKKTICAFTSSYDEILGMGIYMNAWGTPLHPEEVFPTQIDWLLYLCNLAQSSPNLQFIFRIHPREGRDGGSVHLKLLRETFKSPPENVRIIWPEMPISSYDLLEVMDLCLIRVSTMGIECNRVGIPVMSYTRNLGYPNDSYIPIPRDRTEYKEKLYELLEKKITVNDFILASRFYNWKTFFPCIDMRGKIQKTFGDENYWPKCPDSVGLVKDILENKVNIFSYNMKKLKNADFSTEEEKKANLNGINLLIICFMLGFKINTFSIFVKKVFYLVSRIAAKGLKLSLNMQEMDDISFCKKLYKRARIRVVFAEENKSFLRMKSFFWKNYITMKSNEVTLFYKGHKVTRYSPLLARLVSLQKESLN